MDLKKVDELIRMRNNCGAATDVLIIELLSTIANGVTRLVQIEEGKLHGQMELDLRPNTESRKVEEKVEEPVKKPAPKKKVAPKKVEEPKQEVIKEEPKVETQEELPTRDEVMSKLVDFIQNNGEEALANIFKELGGYTNFPAVPQEKYPELLNKIA